MPRHAPSDSPFQGYRRVRSPGLSQRLGPSRDILLLGDGELIHIQTEGFTERCRRIRLSDIQAFVIRPTASAKWTSIILLLVMAGLLWAIIASSHVHALMVFWGIWLALALCFLVINTLLGATCSAQIVTAVQTITLTQFGRIRVAQHIFDALRPTVAQAQGYVAMEAAPEPEAPTDPNHDEPQETTTWEEPGEQVRDFT